ncbi:MAG: zinc-binding protein [Pyrodictiaceae archaeon]
MARRRRKYRKRIPLRPVQKLPTIFECPNCGARALTVTISKKELNEEGRVKAIIKCGKCGLYAEMWVPSIYEPVDVYSKFLDKFLEGSIEYKFTKGEKEVSIGELIASQAGEEGFENWKSRAESSK